MSSSYCPTHPRIWLSLDFNRPFAWSNPLSPPPTLAQACKLPLEYFLNQWLAHKMSGPSGDLCGIRACPAQLLCKYLLGEWVSKLDRWILTGYYANCSPAFLALGLGVAGAHSTPPPHPPHPCPKALGGGQVSSGRVVY